MATSTSTWLTGSNGDWATAAAWSPTGSPNSAGIDVLVNVAPVSSTYTVTVASGSSYAIASLTVGNAGATVRASGTLAFNGGNLAVNQGTVVMASLSTVFSNIGTVSGLVKGRGSISGTGTLTNLGTIIADNNSNTLTIAAPLLNSGTVQSSASGGGSILLISGTASGNLSAGTLTSGTFLAQGSAATENAIRFSINGTTTPLTTNAARLVLDGRTSDIEVRNGATFDSIATQLQSITAAGVLDVRNHRNFGLTNTLANAGTLILQSGTLSGAQITNSGTLSGFGSLKGTVQNIGTISVSGGALDADETIIGSGAISVAAGARLILEGASPGTLHNDGTVYNTVGLLNLGTVTGSGMLVVENGATITLGQATAQNVMFGGADATLRLNDLIGFTGTLSGFGGGDSLFGADRLVLTWVTATAASIVNSNTLAIINAGSTIDTIALSGNYASATFTTTMQGGDAIIRATAGAPARNGLSSTITVNDLAAIETTTENQIVSNLQAALADWGRYITGHAPLRITLTLSNTTNGSRLSEALFGSTILTGETIGGKSIVMPSSIYAMKTGNYIAGSSVDIGVTLYLGGSNLTNLFIDPDPYDSGTIPALKFDLPTVFRHELGHGLGMFGLTNPTTGVLGSQATLYDTLITNSGTVATFGGANAMAAYGTFLGSGTATPVQLTSTLAAQNLFHFANDSADPLGLDLMNGIGIPSGTSLAISAVDIAILRDIGVPITAGIVCYALGTRIATPMGEQTIETLCPGDPVLLRDGAGTRAVPIRWVGHRRIDPARHPRPWQVRPIRIRRDALADGVPARDLLVSPPHGILFDDRLVPAQLLVNHASIVQEAWEGPVDYYHLELDHHAILLAEGVAAESYLDTGNRGFFDNGGPALDLHGDPAPAMPWPDTACAPLATRPEELLAVRRHLSRRARALGWIAATTDDADPHLGIGGRRIEPIAADRQSLRFLVPAGSGLVTLSSRVVEPDRLAPEGGDSRRLGLAISSLVWSSAAGRITIPADHPDLAQGWHPAERDGRQVWRWTDGSGAIPVPDGAAAWMLEVRLGPATRYPLPLPPVRTRAA